MNPIQFKLDDQGKGRFELLEGDERVAEMVVGIRDGNLTAYHTEVSDKLQGQGVAGKLLESMVNYAREHKLKVIPRCAYVHAQFKRNPEKYSDLWNKDE